MRFLLIDDSAPVRHRLRDALVEIPGVSVVEQRGNPGEAFSAFQQVQPDVAIVELKIAQGFGFKQITALKRAFPKTVLILFTQFTLPYYRTRAESAGADFIFLKDRDFELLIQTVAGLATVRAQTRARQTSAQAL